MTKVTYKLRPLPGKICQIFCYNIQVIKLQIKDKYNYRKLSVHKNCKCRPILDCHEYKYVQEYNNKLITNHNYGFIKHLFSCILFRLFAVTKSLAVGENLSKKIIEKQI